MSRLLEITHPGSGFPIYVATRHILSIRKHDHTRCLTPELCESQADVVLHVTGAEQLVTFESPRTITTLYLAMTKPKTIREASVQLKYLVLKRARDTLSRKETP